MESTEMKERFLQFTGDWPVDGRRPVWVTLRLPKGGDNYVGFAPGRTVIGYYPTEDQAKAAAFDDVIANGDAAYEFARYEMRRGMPGFSRHTDIMHRAGAVAVKNGHARGAVDYLTPSDGADPTDNDAAQLVAQWKATRTDP